MLSSLSLKSKVVVTSGGGSNGELELDLLYCRLLQASYLDVKVHAHRHTHTQTHTQTLTILYLLTQSAKSLRLTEETAKVSKIHTHHYVVY